MKDGRSTYRSALYLQVYPCILYSFFAVTYWSSWFSLVLELAKSTDLMSLSCSPCLGGLPLAMNVRILLSCSPYPCITEQCWQTNVPLPYVMVLQTAICFVELTNWFFLHYHEYALGMPLLCFGETRFRELFLKTCVYTIQNTCFIVFAFFHELLKRSYEAWLIMFQLRWSGLYDKLL